MTNPDRLAPRKRVKRPYSMFTQPYRPEDEHPPPVVAQAGMPDNSGEVEPPKQRWPKSLVGMLNRDQRDDVELFDDQRGETR